MEITKLKPRKALNKAFLKVKPNRKEIAQFKENLIQLLDRTNAAESEAFHKNLMIYSLKNKRKKVKPLPIIKVRKLLLNS